MERERSTQKVCSRWGEDSFDEFQRQRVNSLSGYECDTCPKVRVPFLGAFLGATFLGAFFLGAAFLACTEGREWSA